MSPTPFFLRAIVATAARPTAVRSSFSPILSTACRTFTTFPALAGSSKIPDSNTPKRVQDHDDAAAGNVEDDVFQTPYTNLPPLPRDPNEPLETIRARLTYQARKRGILETDLILSTFARENLKSMTIEDCRRFDKFMDEPDWDIYYWVTGKKDVPERWREDPVFLKIVRHAKNEGRVVRQMPPL
ncbi:succinate dehydrogenase assembly factor 2 [Lunasporangiospora selenospora]|uniref:Succinate dehydrogenase assembly factor 2, mitochondrial n=1 Tax=Lunasporangiospora selenospora TaxID=979761 RepID=A0A9P6G094_9FUNG|nr:succinate dehydrogenase assembly factor 2 [Lunasporangiospora selenospora]